MIIHKDDEAPTEVSTVMKSKLDENSGFCSSKTSNIVRKESRMTNRNKLIEVSDVPLKRKVKKLKKKSKNTNISTASSSTDSSIMEISEKDLLELRTAYEQCKSVMRKMKLKYGHLLDAESSDTNEEPSEKRSRLENESVESECQCILNKKIVFDEDGKEVTVNTLLSDHICPTKLVSKNHVVVENKCIDLVYYNESIESSDNLPELRRILKDPSIDIAYRNSVIEKLKLIKQGYWNEVRFSKLSLVEKLKTDPDNVFSFKGSNLSVLTGYTVY